jgi:hypothetical protein
MNAQRIGLWAGLAIFIAMLLLPTPASMSGPACHRGEAGYGRQISLIGMVE